MDCLTFVIGLFVFVGIITALLIKVFNYNIFFILPIVCVIWIFVNPDMVLAANIVSLEAPGESISMASNNDLNIISLSNLPELTPVEENEEDILSMIEVDTSNWILYKTNCRLTYYGMGEDENGKGYAGLGTRGPLTPGQTIASNTLPYGTIVYIEGLGFRTVEDSGSHHLNDGHIDVCSPTWNRHETRSYASTMPQYADVYIVA